MSDASTAEKRDKEGYAEVSSEQLNLWGGIILDAAITVHKELGAGLLESAYELALSRELFLRGFNVNTQVPVELYYKEVSLGKAYAIDILINNEIIIEVNSVDIMHPVFQAQIITYLKLYNRRLGYLINFNVPLLKDGFKRIVNNI
jgi:GxxExxY protein